MLFTKLTGPCLPYFKQHFKIPTISALYDITCDAHSPVPTCSDTVSTPILIFFLGIW